MFSSDDDLPGPAPRSSTSPSPPPGSLAAFRKRSYGEASAASSDGFFFSSDDLAEASIDNYASPRRKKQYRRSCWDAETPDSSSKKEVLKKAAAAKRSKDSGVFMPSSDSSGLEEGFPYHQLSKLSKQVGSPEKRKVTPRASKIFTPSPKRSAAPASRSRDFVREVIDECLEDSNETVDMQNMGIESISNDVIISLRHLIRLPRHQHHPSHESAYESFTPSIKLFLARNQLSRLPNQIVNLRNLAMLSLRNNQLTELPHSIGKLTNLAELNVSFNHLRWLPYELLSLVGGDGKLVNLHTGLNYWIKGTISDDDMPKPSPARRLMSYDQIQEEMDELRNSTELQRSSISSPLLRRLWALHIQAQVALRKESAPQDIPGRGTWSSDASSRVAAHHAWKKDPIYLNSSAITFYNSDGTLTPETSRLYPPPTNSNAALVPIYRGARPNACPADSTNAVQANATPSLFAMALKSCSQTLFLSNLAADLPADTSDTVRNALELARLATEERNTDEREAVEEIGWKCSHCTRHMILPAAEWIEYWHCSPDVSSLPRAESEDLCLPFLRRTCGWSCAMEAWRDGKSEGALPCKAV